MSYLGTLIYREALIPKNFIKNFMHLHFIYLRRQLIDLIKFSQGFTSLPLKK